MKYLALENIAAEFCAMFLWLAIALPVMFVWPGHELASIIFAALAKLLCLQFVAKKKKELFPRFRIRPLYGIAGIQIVLAIANFDLIITSPKVSRALNVICILALGACGCFITNDGHLLQNSSSSQNSEVVST